MPRIVDADSLEDALARLPGEPGVFAPGPLVWAAFAWQVLAVASFSYLCWFVLIRRH